MSIRPMGPSQAGLAGAYPAYPAALKAWSTAAAFIFSGAPTLDGVSGTITGGNIIWPDGATGVYAATLDTNGSVTAFTATYTGGAYPGSHTVSVTIPRNSSSQINGAMTASVS